MKTNRSLLLRVEHLSVSGILNPTSFNLYQGEILVIEKGVQQGATTLLHLLMGVIQEGTGAAEMFEEGEVLNLLSSIKRNNIAYVHEEGGLISGMTVHENLLLPLLYHSSVTKKNSCYTLEWITPYFPEIEKLLDCTVEQLNDVQTRLIVLVRALLQKPSLLLLDELEGGMDYLTVQDFCNSLSQLQQKMGFSIIATTLGQIHFEKERRVYLPDLQNDNI